MAASSTTTNTPPKLHDIPLIGLRWKDILIPEESAAEVMSDSGCQGLENAEPSPSQPVGE